MCGLAMHPEHCCFLFISSYQTPSLSIGRSVPKSYLTSSVTAKNETHQFQLCHSLSISMHPSFRSNFVFTL